MSGNFAQHFFAESVKTKELKTIYNVKNKPYIFFLPTSVNVDPKCVWNNQRIITLEIVGNVKI